MSTYTAEAINPRTGKMEQATFIDDYFGRRRYGVRFADGQVYREDDGLFVWQRTKSTALAPDSKRK
jgi:hypothetical protein